MHKIAKIVLCTLLYLAVFDLIGVIACFFFDVAGVLPLGIGATSTLLFYAIWIVLGIFCGLLSYDAGGKVGSASGTGDWTSRKDAARTGLLVVWIELTIVAAVSILCCLFLWPHDLASSLFVPDNAHLTLVFLVAIVASVILAHTRLRPAPEK